MSATRPLVVGWDGSDGARDAVVWAARTAHRLHRPLRIVFVSNLADMVYGAEPMMVLPQKLTAAQEEEILAPARELAAQTAPGLTIEAECLDGHPVTALVGQSAEAELLVLGSRGRSRFVSTLTGSTGVAVTSHGLGPVVVIRNPPAQDEHGPVVVGVDGSETSKEAVAFAARYADAIGAPLTAVCAVPEPPPEIATQIPLPGEYYRELKERAEAETHEALAGLREDYPDLQVDIVIADEPPGPALARQADTAHLLVVGSHGRGGFAGMLLGSVSRAALFSAACPVAVVRHPRHRRS